MRYTLIVVAAVSLVACKDYFPSYDGSPDSDVDSSLDAAPDGADSGVDAAADADAPPPEADLDTPDADAAHDADDADAETVADADPPRDGDVADADQDGDECESSDDCDDDAMCTFDFCDVSRQCVHQARPELCFDTNPCSDDICDPEHAQAVAGSGCVYVGLDDGESCEGTFFCRVGETCRIGACDPESGTSTCDDDVPCTDTPCNELLNRCDGAIRQHGRCTEEGRGYCAPADIDADTNGCVAGQSCTIPSECDDGVACNGVEWCDVDRCSGGTAPPCDDGFFCSQNICTEPLGTCETTLDHGLCARGLTCWTDTCDPDDVTADLVTGCVAEAVTCESDDAPCTVDACQDGYGCYPPASCGTSDGCCPSYCRPGNDPDCSCADQACVGAVSDGCCSGTCTIRNDADCCNSQDCESSGMDECCPSMCNTVNDSDCMLCASSACDGRFTDGCCPTSCAPAADVDCCDLAGCGIADECCPTTCYPLDDPDC